MEGNHSSTNITAYYFNWLGQLTRELFEENSTYYNIIWTRFDFNGSASACAKKRVYTLVTYWFLFSCRVEDDDDDLSTASTEGLHSKASWCSNTVTSGLNT